MGSEMCIRDRSCRGLRGSRRGKAISVEKLVKIKMGDNVACDIFFDEFFVFDYGLSTCRLCKVLMNDEIVLRSKASRSHASDGQNI